MTQFITTGVSFAFSETAPATIDQSGFTAAGITYTTLAELDNIGPRETTNITHPFTPADDGITRELNAGQDYGSHRIVCYKDATEASQNTIISKGESVGQASWITCRITHSSDSDGKIEYFRGSVKDVEITSRGPNEGVLMLNFTVKLVSKVVTV